MSNYQELLSPVTINKWNLRNKVVMAPLTRGFANDRDGTVTETMIAYYERRAKHGVGLIITEGINPAPEGKGTYGVPGLYTSEQTDSWKQVTEAVHKHGGTIIAQLWHVGRLSHPLLINTTPLAPSEIQADGYVHKVRQPFQIPKAMSQDEISNTINFYKLSAQNAVKAGFDGIEIHAAHGYLIDQFINEKTNVRTDQYGGNLNHRMNFLREIINSVKEVIDSDRISIRISEKKDDDSSYRWKNKSKTIDAFIELFQETGISIIHASTNHFDEISEETQTFHQIIRNKWNRTLIGVGSLDFQNAETAIKENLIDLAAFGRPFIANPDLVQKASSNQPIIEYEASKHLTVLY
ncbi:MAG: alkene reductase [Bacilli bacterium]|nr:alkene reductase [Bacilli bacterium]